jgi:O-antigen/teichoic acid export membrane protein
MLHRTSVFLSVSLAVTAALIFSLGGTWLFELWTRQLLPISQSLLIAFLVAVPANALWYTSSIVLLSANEYEGLARRYVIAALVSLAACYGLTLQIGLVGAALATLAADLVMIPFVMKRSLQLTRDSFPGIVGRLRSDLLTAVRGR